VARARARTSDDVGAAATDECRPLEARPRLTPTAPRPDARLAVEHRRMRASIPCRRGWGRRLVPTMGALHAGPRQLDRARAAECATVVVSIFVNPLQFDRADDLAAIRAHSTPTWRCVRGSAWTWCSRRRRGDVSRSRRTARCTSAARRDHLCGAFRPGTSTASPPWCCSCSNIVQPDVLLSARRTRSSWRSSAPVCRPRTCRSDCRVPRCVSRRAGAQLAPTCTLSAPRSARSPSPLPRPMPPCATRWLAGIDRFRGGGQAARGGSRSFGSDAPSPASSTAKTVCESGSTSSPCECACAGPVVAGERPSGWARRGLVSDNGAVARRPVRDIVPTRRVRMTAAKVLMGTPP
jgi:hypothetical protein